MTTEDEAKTKWCPHAVASHTDPRGGFRKGDEDRDPTFPCLGSACMAWRTVTRLHLKATGDRLEEGRAYQERDVERRPSGGYCGLAGKEGQHQ